MNEHEERSDSIRVPKNSGIEGFLYTIREILKQHTFVQHLEIDSRGFVNFRYLAPSDADRPPFDIDFGFLQPGDIVRNGEVKELMVADGLPASSVVAILFEAASRERLYPVAFASGADSRFWDWHMQTTGIVLQSRETAYGLPFLTDRHLPDSALLLCTALSKNASLTDTRVSYKITMSSEPPPPQTNVDIL